MLQPHACTQRFRFRTLHRTRSFPGRTSARSLSGRIESIWETPSKERGAMFYVRAFARRSLQLSLQSLRTLRSSLPLSRILARPTWRLRYLARHIPARHRSLAARRPRVRAASSARRLHPLPGATVRGLRDLLSLSCPTCHSFFTGPVFLLGRAHSPGHLCKLQPGRIAFYTVLSPDSYSPGHLRKLRTGRIACFARFCATKCYYSSPYIDIRTGVIARFAVLLGMYPPNPGSFLSCHVRRRSAVWRWGMRQAGV